jgi:hypothetical protein
MLTQSQLEEIKARTQMDRDASSEVLREDRVHLLAEVERLLKFVENFSTRVNAQLDILEKDMILLDQDNQRLRKNSRSSDFERDACIGLVAKMALALNLPVGTQRTETAEVDGNGQEVRQLQNRVVLDLPSGQVAWDYLDSEAHLFETLPTYTQPVEVQSIQETYLKVMNPNLNF